MPELHEQTLAELSGALAAGELSSVDATEHVLARIDRFDGRHGLNAYLHVATDSALGEAHAADSRRAAGTRKGPLDGVPIALKDLVDTSDMRTTGGSPVFSSRTPDRDATIVRKLREAGAVILGKTNMLEFAYGHPHPNIGETANPWDLSRTAGGSSGGSAAAIAAGMAWGAIGSDTGGSIRSPAAYCGVAGLKPTYGLVSVSGVLPLSWSLDHVGPLARTAEDCALLLSVIAGHDLSDPYSATRDRIDDVIENIAPLISDAPTCPGLRVGVLPQMFESTLTPGLREVVETAVTTFRDELGAKVFELCLDQEVIDSVLPAVARIYQVEAAAYHRLTTRDRWTDFGPVLRAGLEDALELPAVDYVDAQRARIRLGRAFGQLYQQADLLLWPAHPVVAPLIGTTDAVVPGAAGNSTTIDIEIAATGPANLFGEPAISIPCGFTDGLPVGLHLQGPQFSDHLVLQAAMAYQSATGAPPLPPLIS